MSTFFTQTGKSLTHLSWEWMKKIPRVDPFLKFFPCNSTVGLPYFAKILWLKWSMKTKTAQLSHLSHGNNSLLFFFPFLLQKEGNSISNDQYCTNLRIWFTHFINGFLKPSPWFEYPFLVYMWSFVDHLNLENAQ